MSRETCEQLARKHTPEHCLEAAFRFLLDRERKESILGRLRRDGDLALFPRIRAGASAIPLAALIGRIGDPEAYFATIVESSTISYPTIQSGGTRAPKRSPQSTPTSALENFRSMVHRAQL